MVEDTLDIQLRLPNRQSLHYGGLVMILYDTKEQKYKLIIDTYKTNSGFTVYKANDGKEYGFGKSSDYIFVTMTEVVELLNKENK